MIPGFLHSDAELQSQSQHALLLIAVTSSRRTNPTFLTLIVDVVSAEELVAAAGNCEPAQQPQRHSHIYGPHTFYRKLSSPRALSSILIFRYLHKHNYEVVIR